MSGFVQLNVVKSRSLDGTDQSIVKKENRRPFVTSEYQKRVDRQGQEEDQTCDEDCQSKCRLFNPNGDCSHCGCDDQEHNSSHIRLSVTCRPIVGQQVTDTLPTHHRQWADAVK